MECGARRNRTLGRSEFFAEMASHSFPVSNRPGRSAGACFTLRAVAKTARTSAPRLSPQHLQVGRSAEYLLP